jgi:hypothetical protein
MNKFLSLVLLEGALIASLGISNVAAERDLTLHDDSLGAGLVADEHLIYLEAKKKYFDFRSAYLTKLEEHPDCPSGACLPFTHKINQLQREVIIGENYLSTFYNDSSSSARAIQLYEQYKAFYLSGKPHNSKELKELFANIRELPLQFQVPFQVLVPLIHRH